MGQIFSRIARITKSQFGRTESSFETDLNLTSDEDDLKNIINELNKKKEYKESGRNNQSYSNEETSKSSNVLTLDKAYEILGIPVDSQNDKIKSAYLQKIKEYHPDKVASLGSELKILAERKTQEINISYDLICKSRNIN